MKHIPRTRLLSAAILVLLLLLGCIVEATPTAKTPLEVLYISNKYVFPTHITRPKGQFLMIVKNHSNLKHLMFHIKKNGSGTDVVLADVDEEEGKFQALLDLEPGTYTLFEPGHPKLTCTLTITP